jgi:DNA-binding transcriptional MocR family regulator
MKRYQHLAEQLSNLIRAGVLRPGERVPSVRQAQRSYKVSQSTVLAAYRLLESHGQIAARPRSGYYVNPHWAGLPLEPQISRPALLSSEVDVSDLVFEILESMKRANVVPFGSAFMNPRVYPFSKLARFLGWAARRVPPGDMAEGLPPGNADLIRGIARRYLACGFAVRPEEIIITSGSTEALYLCLQAVARRGDVIAIESPAYYAGLQAIELLGMKALQLPTHPREGIELGPLANAVVKHRVKACWVMTNFQNPLGSLMPHEKKEELVKLLAKHDVPLIEDDVHEELYFSAEKPKPAKFFDQSRLVLHCSSFSNCLAPGYRVGWASGGVFAERVEKLKLTTTLATNICAQAAIAAYLKDGAHDHYLRGVRRSLVASRDAMLGALARHFPSGTRCTRPEGGYFLWVELPSSVSALKLHRQAMDSGISLAPGPIFSARRRFENCIRLNYGAPWSPGLEKAMSNLGKMAASLM